MPSKKTHIHFYADECIPIPTVTYLRKKGFTIIHAYDKGFIQKEDVFHLKQASKINYVLLSLDKDFNKFENSNLENHPGVILISVGNVFYDHINKVLFKTLKHITKDYVKESIIRATINKLTKEKNGVKVSEKFFK